MGTHTDPRKTFYLAFSASWEDGTLDVENECATPHDTEEEAVAAAQAEVEDGGGEYFVYRATPLCRIHRVSVQVERFAEPPDSRTPAPSAPSAG